MPSHSQAGSIDILRDALDIEGRVNRNPYGTVAAAVGVGFVLGGGIFTRLGARIVGAGVRVGLMAALPLFQKQLGRIIEQSFDNLESGTKSGERT
jgi:hypothetical protein